MPKYELMYIVASTVSDDQIPTVTDGVLNLVKGLGGIVTNHEELGKKKLAYPIQKTRNGFYDLIGFEIEGAQINELNNKVLTTDGIIRHIIVNLEESIKRQEKDRVAQEKLNRNREEKSAAAESFKVKEEKPESTAITEENLDEKIEEALNEDLKNI